MASFYDMSRMSSVIHTFSSVSIFAVDLDYALYPTTFLAVTIHDSFSFCSYLHPQHFTRTVESLINQSRPFICAEPDWRLYQVRTGLLPRPRPCLGRQSQ